MRSEQSTLDTELSQIFEEHYETMINVNFRIKKNSSEELKMKYISMIQKHLSQSQEFFGQVQPSKEGRSTVSSNREQSEMETMGIKEQAVPKINNIPCEELTENIINFFQNLINQSDVSTTAGRILKISDIQLNNFYSNIRQFSSSIISEGSRSEYFKKYREYKARYGEEKKQRLICQQKCSQYKKQLDELSRYSDKNQ